MAEDEGLQMKIQERCKIFCQEPIDKEMLIAKLIESFPSIDKEVITEIITGMILTDELIVSKVEKLRVAPSK